MSAAALLREAGQSGVKLRLADGKPKVSGTPSPELLTALREHKAAIIQILRGDRCRWCGSPLDWPRPVGVVFADGTAECMPCGDAEVERLWRAAQRVTQSPEGRADEAELMLRPGGLA